jgi:hypothetical protein
MMLQQQQRFEILPGQQQQHFEILPGQQQRALKFCSDNNKRTTLVVIPSTSTKEKRQRGSCLTCASGTRFSLHPCW